MKFRAGSFEIDVAEGSHPIWSRLSYEGRELRIIHHRELKDLAFVVQRAIAHVTHLLPDRDKGEMA